MKHIIQFPSGRYFTNSKPGIENWGSVFSTINLLEANVYDDIKIAKKIVRGSCKGTKIISISKKELFCRRLKGVEGQNLTLKIREQIELGFDIHGVISNKDGEEQTEDME